MSLSPEQRREYRALAHNLKPVVIIGDKGISENLIQEAERALADHELIKVKVAFPEKESREQAVSELCQQTGAELVQMIGKIAVLLKRSSQPDPKLSNLARAARARS